VVSNFLRRLPLPRLLLLCGVTLAVGIGAAALAVGLGTGPTPPPKPLAQAVHDALSAPAVAGVSARIQLTDHLIEGSSLESQGGGGGGSGSSGASSPLLEGASGRLWISNEGLIRVELQAEQGDTEIFYDGHTVTLYDAASNSLYRYTPPRAQEEDNSGKDAHKIPTVAEIQEAIVRIMRHANLSSAVPTDVAGQPAYSVRISPSHDGGLIGGAELAWDAVHGAPLRFAIYSTTSSSPVVELVATEVSYGPVSPSVFAFSPPPGAEVTEVKPPTREAGTGATGAGETPRKPISGLAAVQAAVPFTLDAPATLAGMAQSEVQLVNLDGHHPAALITYGEGLGGLAVLESAAKGDTGASKQTETSPESMLGELPKVQLSGASATELPTALGTLLSFKRSGIDYLLAGSVTPAVAQAAARGL
jgi:outer membrane lipoprotein-sorting protein